MANQSADRIYLTGANYASRCSGAFDGECDAPGANDDGSGVVGIIEAARMTALHELDATVVFVTFAGEEQGLYDSGYFAEQAVEEGLDVAGVLNIDMIGNSTGRGLQRAAPGRGVLRGRAVKRVVGGGVEAALRRR